MSMRPILPVTDVAVVKPAGPSDVGSAPQLQWIKIADLVVDETYQRSMSLAGRRNVRAIAEGFRWAAFSPVIVSPVVGGQFAIVDGQHRTTAAALCGFESVPCQVVIASANEQAVAFRRINGNTTKIHPMHMFHAAVASGDPEAVAAMDVAKEAGVTILRSPTKISELKPGQTCSFGAIVSGVKTHGRETVLLSLRALRGPGNDVRGLLVAPIIKAAGNVFAECLRIRPAAAVLEAFDKVKVIKELDPAMADARQRGVSVEVELTRRLLDRVHRALSQAAA